MQPKLKANKPTMSYTYGNNDQEFVFCVKGRPFPCLVSPHIPTPTASLLDYHLVRCLCLPDIAATDLAPDSPVQCMLVIVTPLSK